VVRQSAGRRVGMCDLVATQLLGYGFVPDQIGMLTTFGELRTGSEPGVGSTLSLSHPLAQGFGTPQYFENQLSGN
jgi:hypothetical protein